MAAAGPAARPGTMSRKEYKAALKKERRRKRRQELARRRDAELPPSEAEEDAIAEERRVEEERLAEEERQRLHRAWLLREEKAQEEFRAKKEREEAARRRKEEEERKLRAEWEELQRREREEEEQKRQERREREEAVRQMLRRAEEALGGGGPWQNPEPPPSEVRERGRASCPFYSKTGACRFGERCSRAHDFPASSPTLLLKSMFTTFGMEQSRRDDYDPDASLEYSDEETYQQFLDFYHDALPEFKKVGRVVQFKVSCNLEPHLRGNVYVQYQSEEDCRAAFSLFNGRWYAGRQLQCEFCPVTRWKVAICGLFEVQQCPRGKHCNFLHVFRNPSNEFREANRDTHLSPDWPSSSLGKNWERRERTGHHDEHYVGSRRRSLSPERSYERKGESDRKSGSNHRGGKSHKHMRQSRERRRSLSRGRRRDHSPVPWSKSRRSRRSRSRSSSRSRSHGRRKSGSRDRTTQSPKAK
ncbi:U2 small nuclear ribonucleoprotein auxiliary factor 35 kDa subunit-related protein 2-like [Peromyscus leucopus]|uniref:U2 small nuclear ribonucleoprotein auxiliary factor 35 kDa subunit-related protein 2-like n=1 Tax=Peromyscus leucopus TaxID=10041 RepID=UPI001884F751|nr:U2 small nuclear ribonucleoprotein auxiliary factor 35 kDa subunit-related protein 2-like [Peromyscus leucopus]